MQNTTTLCLLRLADVSAKTGLARSTIHDAIRAGTFPRPVPLGSRTVAWSSAEIEQWISARIAARDAKAGA
ncbi:Prophage CP4-57 regulatory [mine drainage metagenome]|uniref:Prophage CP4-57 regulatory n=1 Tax=mine drainage metagenome TaxID=410659 RepID=T0XUL0_9ZZZZ